MAEFKCSNYVIKELSDKKQKTIKITAIVISIIIAIISISLLISYFVPNTKSYALNENLVTINYKEEIPYNSLNIKYKNALGNKEKIILVDSSMIEDFDPENVNKQTIKVKYKKITLYMDVKINPLELASPQAEIHKNLLTWNAIENADSYDVFKMVNGEPVFIASTTNTELDLVGVDINGEQDLVVIAKSSKPQYKASSNSELIDVNKLDDVKNIKYDGSLLSWDEVENATAYEIYLNGEKVKETTELKATVALAIGNNNIQIKAIGKDKVSSLVETKFIKLSSQELKTEANYVKWTQVPLATMYQVYIGDNENDLTLVQEGKDLKFDISKYIDDKKHFVKVLAIGNGENVINSDMSTVEFCIFKGVENIKYTNGNLTWTEIPTAEGYDVIVNEKEFKNVKSNNLEIEFVPGKNNISIAATSSIAHYYQINPTKSTIKKLANIEGVKYISPILSWDSLYEASAYDVYVDGVLKFKDVNENKKDLDITEKGVHIVKIIGKNSTGKIVNSNPAICNVAIGINIQIANNILKVNEFSNEQYELYTGDILVTEFSTTTIDISKYIKNSGMHNINVRIKNAFGNSNSIAVTKLNKPVIQKQGQELMISGGSKYEFYDNGVKFDGKLSSIKVPGEHNVKVYNVAFNANEINSEYAELNLIKLEPTSVVVKNQEIVLGTNKICKYYLDGETFDGDLSQITVPKIYKLGVKVLANDEKELDSELKIVNIEKLDKPSITIKDGELKKPDGIQLYINGVEYKEDIAKLIAGTYQIKAKRIALNDNILDSELSNEINITKLATPVVKYEDSIKVYGTTTRYLVYLDGEVYLGDLNTVQDGSHIVSAQNLANAENELNSAVSEPIKVLIGDTIIEANKSYNGEKLNIAITSKTKDVVYDVYIDFYKSGSKFTSTKFLATKKDFFDVSLTRGGITADEVRITVKVNDLKGENITQTSTVYKEK